MLAIAIKDDAIKVDGFTHAEPFFSSNLQDPVKAVLVRWKPEKLKVPVFRQAVRMSGGLATSEHKALRYSHLYIILTVWVGQLALRRS
jgi:hypothetical protein